jgi:hypothetical protein
MASVRGDGWPLQLLLLLWLCCMLLLLLWLCCMLLLLLWLCCGCLLHLCFPVDLHAVHCCLHGPPLELLVVVRLPRLQGVAHDKGSMLISWPWHMPMLHPVSDEHVPERPGGKPGWAAHGCQDMSLELWAEGARGERRARFVEEEGLGVTAG